MTNDSESKKEITKFENPFSIALEVIDKMTKDSKEQKRQEYIRMNPTDKFKMWVRHDTWILKSEAIPLIMGYSPDYLHLINHDRKFLNDVYRMAKSGDLVVNSELPEKQWAVGSLAFLKWASRKNINIDVGFLEIYNSVNPDSMLNKRRDFDFGIDVAQYYTEPHLDKLKLIVEASLHAIDEKWKNYDADDRTTAPNSADVISFLKDEYGDLLSDRDRAVIQAAIRHPLSAGGGTKR